MTNEISLPPPTMDWKATDPLQAFWKSKTLAEFCLEDQNVSKRPVLQSILPVRTQGHHDMETTGKATQRNL